MGGTQSGCWRDGSAVKNTHCFCRGPEFGSWPLHGAAPNPITLAPGWSNAPGFLGYLPHMYKYTPLKNNINFRRKPRCINTQYLLSYLLFFLTYIHVFQTTTMKTNPLNNKLYTQNGFFFQNFLMLILLKNLRIKTVQQGRIVTYLHSASEKLVYNCELKGNGLQFTPQVPLQVLFSSQQLELPR